MSVLLDWSIQPVGLVFIMLLAAQVWLWLARNAPLLPRLALLVATFVFWLSSSPVVANALVHKVESASSAASEQCRAPDGSLLYPIDQIAVLGADLDAYTVSDNAYEVLSSESLIRTLFAARLDSGENRFFLLGGGRTERKLSDFMADVLVDQGIDNERIVRERISLSTLENAKQLTRVLEPSQAGVLGLVTSSLHLNRASQIFAAQGYRICALGAGSMYSVSSGWVGYLPYIDPLVKTTKAWREVLSTLLHRLKSPGRSLPEQSNPKGSIDGNKTQIGQRRFPQRLV